MIGLIKRWLRRLFQILAPTIIIPLWRKLDKDKAWPDVEFFIDNTPIKIWGGVGGDSYTGWIYQQGFFAALIKCYAPHESLRIFDFGCGYGKVAPISVFFTHPDGKYIGVDLRQDCIDFCKYQYSHLPRVEFALTKGFNACYSEQKQTSTDKNVSYKQDWPVTDQFIDIVTAISVFTHLQEKDALDYMNKIYDILKPNGLAILTFHIVEEPRKQPTFISPEKPHLVDVFDFHTPLPTTYNWFTSNPKRPEDAIAVNMKGLSSLMQGKFKMEFLIKGSTTGGHDPFFQDIVILRKNT